MSPAPSPSRSPSVLTTGQLARLLVVNRHLLTRWCNSGELKCYRLPGRQQRRIKFEIAWDFARQQNLPTEYLEAWGQEHGMLPLRCPNVLLVSPVASSLLPFLASVFAPSIATSSLRVGLTWNQRVFRAVLIDAAIGATDVQELLTVLRELAPRTVLAVLAAEDDQRPKLWRGLGAHAVWQRPCDLAQVAHELWSMLSAAAVLASAPSAPSAPRPKRAA